MRLVGVRSGHGPVQVYVNPGDVTHVTPAGGGARIHLRNGQWFAVDCKDVYADVVRPLELAANR